MRQITILSTACGAMFMPGFFKCLKNNGERKVRIIGTDVQDDKSMAFIVDRYYKVSAYTSENYIDEIIEICRREHVDVVFPHISMELPLYLRNYGRFKEMGINVAISNTETLLIANDKYELYRVMLENELPVPKHFLIESKQDLINYSKLLGYPNNPFCVKLAVSSGSRGVRVIKPMYSRADAFLHEKPNSMIISLEEMCDILDDMTFIPKMFAMPFLKGPEYTVDLLAENGKTLYIAGRCNTTSSFSIAQSSFTAFNASVYSLCERIVSMLKLDGNIGFDFLYDENGELVLTDLNPRVTATIVLYAAAGINFPYLRVKQLLKEPLPNVSLEEGVGLVRKYEDLLYNRNGRVVL